MKVRAVLQPFHRLEPALANSGGQGRTSWTGPCLALSRSEIPLFRPIGPPAGKRVMCAIEEGDYSLQGNLNDGD